MLTIKERKLMKILVLSDSHSAISFMRFCVDAIRPDAIVHLGDYFEDGGILSEEYPQIPMYQVPGNCDRFRCPRDAQEIRIEPVLGVPLYMTHGHRHNVKLDTGLLLQAARLSHVAAVLYGHTHVPGVFDAPECDKSERKYINPGSVSIPKEGSAHGYMTLTDGRFEWKTLEGDLFREYLPGAAPSV